MAEQPPQGPTGPLSPGGRPLPPPESGTRLPPPQPPKKSNATKVILIVLGVLAALAALGIGGCVACTALVGSGVNKAVEEVEQQAAETEISEAEADSVELGSPRSEVIRTLGQPRSTDERRSQRGDRGACIYYGVQGGDLLDQWQFCFDARDRLESKER